ncbi:MAG TPA: hypothetical protein VGP64_13185 [Polyangia bacterium]|jgi:hypothetical protein
MMSARGWIALSSAIAVCGAGTRLTLACGQPRSLLGPPARVVARAEQIVWAEASGRQPIPGDDQAARYTFKVLRVFRGQLGATIEVVGSGDGEEVRSPSYDRDSNFANHTSPEFWTDLHGRMAFGGDCQMIPPYFAIGHRYLLLLGPPDLKQFERVDSEDDRWFQFVRDAARAPAEPLPPPVERSRRVVELSPRRGDSSCLENMGGTTAATELSEGDLRNIDALIRKRDRWPVIAIDHIAAFRDRYDRSPGDLDFEATTGVGCGAHAGRGRSYRLKLVRGRWTVASVETWVSGS